LPLCSGCFLTSGWPCGDFGICHACHTLRHDHLARFLCDTYNLELTP
jgi:hypothetical protein